MFELPTFSGDVVVAAQMYWRKNKNGAQGPVVQSVVSLTSSLRVISLTSSLRVILLTVLADSIYNILIFFAEKMWVAFASYSHFFSKKFQHIWVSLNVNFNESLTNDIVSFEQLGPGIQSVSLRHRPPAQPHHHETVIAPSPLIFFFFFFVFENLLVYKYHLKYDKVQKCVESSFGNQIWLILSICLRIGLLGHNLTWKRKRKYFHYIIGDGLYPLFLGHHGTENDWLVYFVYLEKQTQLIFYYLKLILDIFWQPVSPNSHGIIVDFSETRNYVTEVRLEIQANTMYQHSTWTCV